MTPQFFDKPTVFPATGIIQSDHAESRNTEFV